MHASSGAKTIWHFGLHCYWVITTKTKGKERRAHFINERKDRCHQPKKVEQMLSMKEKRTNVINGGKQNRYYKQMRTDVINKRKENRCNQWISMKERRTDVMNEREQNRCHE